ncbi:TIGR00730 family Rossman fold protein [Aquimarina sp. AD10]|uniref:LOG family protein n=1 Tax=Aquimarina sp. AD10 TaxID=1714849 RepID=UPI000E4D8932|nr:TIGR00730 family Rossman fold protein [Aquimarina sp. AD10]AXT63491.1 TIGR00730 family Rossman fold protein [Aquimarina sp. AD10]RKM99791.1 TIGR00730 family Rossman fold protein [Aquimarina sp. AD10]
MTTLNSICVFCGSSEGNDITIIEKGFSLGEELARRQITLVYGAAKIGIMGKVAEGALTSKGKVIGVIPEFLKLKEVMHLGLHELITTENMHQRKMKMHDLSDGFITLPGGFGTLEELFEIITWAQLGLHQKPIGLLNVGGFYDDLLQLLETMVRRGFLKIENYELLIVDDSIDQLLEKMKMFKPKEVPKWLKPERT